MFVHLLYLFILCVCFLLSDVAVFVWSKQGFLSGDGPLSDIDIDIDDVSAREWEKQMLAITIQPTKYFIILIHNFLCETLYFHYILYMPAKLIFFFGNTNH